MYQKIVFRNVNRVAATYQTFVFKAKSIVGCAVEEAVEFVEKERVGSPGVREWGAIFSGQKSISIDVGYFDSKTVEVVNID